MASRRERIVAAVAAVLGAASATVRGEVHPAPAGLRVERNRRRPSHADHLPVTVVYTLRETGELETHGDSYLARRVLRIGLEHRAIGEPDDQALDELVTWGTRALLADPSLGGLALGVDEQGIEWDGADEDHPYASASQIFEVEYETPEDDPEG